jgi:hypothetical protein
VGLQAKPVRSRTPCRMIDTCEELHNPALSTRSQYVAETAQITYARMIGKRRALKCWQLAARGVDDVQSQQSDNGDDRNSVIQIREQQSGGLQGIDSQKSAIALAKSGLRCEQSEWNLNSIPR